MVAAVRSEDPLLTVADAAAYMAVEPSWLYDRWRELNVPMIKLGSVTSHACACADDGRRQPLRADCLPRFSA